MLFRDPLGQKPLYYYVYSDGLIYASELRALLALEQFGWKIDTQTFYRYLTNGYYCWDTTPLVGVKKLLPGHYLAIERDRIAQKRWWHSLPGANPLQIDPDQAVDGITAHLEAACQGVLQSDIPVGVFLSGGIDSSLVLAACHSRDASLRSYSVGMTEKDYDESDKALSVAKLVGSSHREVTIAPPVLRDHLATVLANIDEPHGDPGFINMFALSRAAKPYITVAIAGDGADELFCGYLPFRTLRYARVMQAMPSPLLNIARRAAGLLPGSDTYLGLKFKAMSWLNGFPAHASKRPNLWLSTLPAETIRGLFTRMDSGEFSRDRRGGFFDFPTEVYEASADCSPPDQLSYFYQQVFLPEFVCHHTDRAAMLNSMEVRSPFLSRPLIEFANRLPASIRMRNGVLKWPLRKALTRLGFPAGIVNQRKQGFTLPLARWQKGELRPEVLTLRDIPEAVDGVISSTNLGRVIDEHLEGQVNN